MRLLTAFLFLIPLAAQDPVKPAADSAKPADQPAPAAPEAAGDNWLQGSIELGYRWIPDLNGNLDAYRSVVNLGEGPKLLDADFTLFNPSKRLFDRADVHATSWGGDPYNTLRVEIQKEKIYRLLADYRNIAYFNFLPSYADPTLNQGVLLNQNSYDTAIRTLHLQLDLLPGKWITPYLGFDRNTQFGSGVTVFHTDQNDFPVASLYSDQTNSYHAGVRMELGRYHVTIEEGGTTFKDDQGASDHQINSGNVPGMFLGEPLTLSQMQEQYRVRSNSTYTKILGAANPYSWLSVTGQFVYSRPHTDVRFSEASAGNFFSNDLFEFYNGNQDVLTGAANTPHTFGTITVELRPFKRMRIVQYWNTERYHNSANALLAENLLFTGSPALTDQQLASDRLSLNESQEEVDVYYDLTARLTLRGGYRYEWGNTDLGAPILSGLTLETAKLRRSIGIAGVNFRLNQKLRIVANAEGSNSNDVFFRTSLEQYEKARIRASYDVLSSLRFAADFSVLNNSNPDPSVKLDFRSRVESASLFWTPRNGKWGNLLLDYSRSSVRSNILYLIPQTLTPAPSIYKENAHALTAVVSVKWFSFGGSLFVSSGSRPTQYYQPLARFSLPLNKHVRWNTEWRYYSMSEAFYAFENFRSNQLMTSLRFTR
ncbi:MAG TPA: hypothetical protein VKT81_02565 [Bryobacteraceae bacterium]|nr:hypothetical protein [Bryobacteraceae bacterium]